ncbi:baseplate J/gp47 family protein [Roseateles sp. SL47]|uniref:baseplate J/gp47 family protein n=1 Tax=Roseateles sp. SL47 TaxID=2995138 RepID=UPI00226EE378|nr:baseplate J/gp47 family protein [Roseateles sp. SL47]WAC71110.1 baseplate J/gp47 family protein [Roseateles sp. SL47]
MAIEIPDFDTLRARYLQQVANQQPQAATGSDSDHYVRASAVAAAVESLHQHIWWLARQHFPDTADPDYLERQASLYGLARKAAAVASGTVTLTGEATTPVSAGLLLQAANGQQYEVTENTAIGGSGSVNVAAWALLAGPAGNLSPTDPLTIVVPVAGITAAAVATMDGGDVSEDDASLRARLLERMRNAPAGGNSADYVRWATEVAGVGRAWCFGGRRGLGTVDVAIRALDGLPSAGLIEAVEDHIEEHRPVTSDVLVLQPDLVEINITATVILSGVSLASAQASAATAIAAYVDQLAPGDTVYLSRLSAAIQDVPGVVNVVITAPVANVETSVNVLHLELAQMGTLTLGV